jgi:proteasome lid subunit RPN8/RPN11
MLLIEKQVLTGMIEHAEANGDECCGFFFGHEQEGNRTLTKFLVVKNVSIANQHNNFEIASDDYLRAESLAERENLALLGVYHSHPNGSSLPSEYDRLAAQPNFSYVILSVAHKRFSGIRSWQLTTHFQFKEEDIVFVQTPKK